MRIAIEGAGGGDLDRAYEAVRQLYVQKNIRVDLLICCGDFQPVRDEEDLEQIPRDPEYKSMRDFHKYYKGEKLAPVTTIFVGGRNEPPNYLRELYYGGWVAPRIYYLGCAGVVQCGNIRIAGLSGVFKPQDYFRGHYEIPPFTDTTRMTALNMRECDVARLESVTGPVDIVVSYDWPRGIWKHGDVEDMLSKDLNGNMKMEIDANTVGSPAAMDVLMKLRPAFWFSARPNMKFAALVPHDDGTFTRFLGLDRCSSWKEYLQVLDVDPRSPSCLRKLDSRKKNWTLGGLKPIHLDYDPEWLAIQKMNHAHLRLSWENAKATVLPPRKEDVAWIARKLREGLKDGVRKRKTIKRHQSLLPMKLREHGGGATFKDLPIGQLRDLFVARGLEFPGHLDKASLVRQLEDHDEFFAAERGEAGDLPDESYPIPENFAATLENPLEQRRALLRLLELDDFLSKQDDQEPQKPHTGPNIIDALKEAAAAAVVAEPAIVVLDDVAEPEGATLTSIGGDASPELATPAEVVAQSTAVEETTTATPSADIGKVTASAETERSDAARTLGEANAFDALPGASAEGVEEVGSFEGPAADSQVVATVANTDEGGKGAAVNDDTADDLAVSDIYGGMLQDEGEGGHESVPNNEGCIGVEEAFKVAVSEAQQRGQMVQGEMGQESMQDVAQDLGQVVEQEKEPELEQQVEQVAEPEAEQEQEEESVVEQDAEQIAGIEDAYAVVSNALKAQAEVDTPPVAIEPCEVEPEFYSIECGKVAEVDPFMAEDADEWILEVPLPEEEVEPNGAAENDPYAVIDPYEEVPFEDPYQLESIEVTDEPPRKFQRLE